MSFAVTPELKLEIEQLIEDRKMSAVDGQRLFAAIVGDGGKARDAPFFAAAQLMIDLLVPGDASPARRRIDMAIALVMDNNAGASRRIDMKLAANPARGSRGRPEIPASLVLFLLTNDTCAYFNDMRSALLAAAESAAEDTENLPELARAFGRIIYKIRQQHLPHEALGKEHLALIRFLRLNGALASGVTITDDLILRYWLDRGREGARLTYRSSVMLLLGFEQLQFDKASLTGMSEAADVTSSDWDDTAGAAAAAEGLAGSMAGDSLAVLVDNLPAEPKLLTQAERERLRRVFALAPYHRARPHTVMRFLTFGDVQANLIQQARMGGGAPDLDKAMSCAAPYVETHAGYGALYQHMIKLADVARALTAQDDAHDDLQLRKKLTGFRRFGFDRPIDELASIFDEISSDLSMIGLGARTFMNAINKLDAAKSLAQRYADDTQVFRAAFHTMFDSESFEAMDDDAFI